MNIIFKPRHYRIITYWKLVSDILEDYSFSPSIVEHFNDIMRPLDAVNPEYTKWWIMEHFHE